MVCSMHDDDRIIRQRISGRSVREIAKTQRATMASINEARRRYRARA